jgi:hypothetical protein
VSAPVITPASVGQSTPALAPVLQVDLARGSVVGTGSWVTVFGQQSIKPNQTTGKTDNSDADTGRWTSQAVTTLGRVIECVFERKTYTGSYDAGQEELRALAASDPPLLCHYRMFNRYGGPDPSEEGFAVVEWSPNGGGQADTAKTNVTLTVQGKPTTITNPVATSTAPTAYSVTPSTSVATGALVTIRGSNCLSVVAFGAAGVKFGATNATSFTAPNDNTIIAVVPATGAGSQPVTLTNATGTSTPALAFTHA